MQPAQLEANTLHKIIGSVKKMVKALELDNCACHTELKVMDEIPYIIENGARLGGDYITSDLTPLSTGVNMEQELIKICLGELFITPIIKNDYALYAILSF